ncbi:MAG: two-component system chemotaxis response regulator CheB [Colwellia sp.]|jgi:two-component system chemotaxis response regulator CheB
MSIRVFIIDDSAVVRKVLTDILTAAAGIEVIGSAQDPIFALAHMEKNWPDVITLDIEMPRMDGITFLKKIMVERPTPIVMCSTLTEKGSQASLDALRFGAIDVVAKPKSDVKTSLPESSRDLVNAIKVAAKANMAVLKPMPIARISPNRNKFTADAMLDKGHKLGLKKAGPLIAIGASTGGTQAIAAVLAALPSNTLPILIVQHMPAHFTHAFAKRLNEVSRLEVKEAQDNDALLPGLVLVAPGGKHMMLQVTQFGSSVKIKDGPPVNRHKPSVDVLFRSVAKYAGANALGIIMTGMGDDGAVGMKEMRDAGAKTIAQNVETCVVYGMPAVAVKLGGVDHVLALSKIPQMIVQHRRV